MSISPFLVSFLDSDLEGAGIGPGKIQIKLLVSKNGLRAQHVRGAWVFTIRCVRSSPGYKNLRLWLFHGTREFAAECITENEFQARW